MWPLQGFWILALVCAVLTTTDFEGSTEIGNNFEYLSILKKHNNNRQKCISD